MIQITSSHTECACSVCDHSNNEQPSRKLQGVSSGVLGVVAVTISSLRTFEVIISTITTFNSVSDLQSTLLILVTFAVLWLLLPFASFVVSSLSEKFQNKGKKRVRKTTNSRFAFKAYVDSLLGDVIGYSRLWTAGACNVARFKV